jgi:hypothetical protein
MFCINSLLACAAKQASSKQASKQATKKNLINSG